MHNKLIARGLLVLGLLVVVAGSAFAQLSTPLTLATAQTEISGAVQDYPDLMLLAVAAAIAVTGLTIVLKFFSRARR